MSAVPLRNTAAFTTQLGPSWPVLGWQAGRILLPKTPGFSQATRKIVHLHLGAVADVAALADFMMSCWL